MTGNSTDEGSKCNESHGERYLRRPDPSALMRALGAEVVTQMAEEGDMEAQWSLGYTLMGDGNGGRLGAGGRTPVIDVGLTLSTYV